MPTEHLNILLQKNLILALAHITGGGLTENIPRVLTNNICVSIDGSKWKMPKVFGWLQSVSQIKYF